MSDAAYEVRSLHRAMEIHDDGDTLAKINETFQKMMNELIDRQMSGEKATATFNISFVLKAHQKGVDVAITHEAKMPKKAPTVTAFFVTEKNTLTTKNPKQREFFDGKGMSRAGNTSAG
jgi:negative regulator of genetic competence, sporulation and motility